MQAALPMERAGCACAASVTTGLPSRWRCMCLRQALLGAGPGGTAPLSTTAASVFDDLQTGFQDVMHVAPCEL